MSSIEPIVVPLEQGSVTVRTGLATDGPSVLSLLKLAAGETEFLARGCDEFTSTEAEHSAVLQRQFASPVDLYLVAELDGKLIGIGYLKGSLLRRFKHELTLAVVVLREHWSKGVGSALMRSLLDWADAGGFVRISLEVAATNTRAIKLYESLGFEPEGRLRARSKHGEEYVDNFLMGRVRFIALREATASDSSFLEEMLYEAFFWNPAQERPPIAQVRQRPEFSALLAGWGRSGDIALIAERSGLRLGAAWFRLWTIDEHSYGFVDEETPELGIAVAPHARQQGIGRSLLRALIEAASVHGHTRLSLSVAPTNPARTLYESEGFAKVGEEGTSWTMLRVSVKTPATSSV